MENVANPPLNMTRQGYSFFFFVYYILVKRMPRPFELIDKKSYVSIQMKIISFFSVDINKIAHIYDGVILFAVWLFCGFPLFFHYGV